MVHHRRVMLNDWRHFFCVKFVMLAAWCDAVLAPGFGVCVRQSILLALMGIHDGGLPQLRLYRCWRLDCNLPACWTGSVVTCILRVLISKLWTKGCNLLPATRFSIGPSFALPIFTSCVARCLVPESKTTRVLLRQPRGRNGVSQFSISSRPGRCASCDRRSSAWNGQTQTNSLP
ncbi:hypothetical protein QBC34DRAFT_219257 [Podospora aff. communis PSN243]|uniref:Secreted protein n=1 Tax=Podospora aff. communis PSN243 TaxID=3040156 RepID=A0AAV9GZS0_9PEZI|nr:hypothetical protein QBC34DRAFT_219257 [Podospora aff. communis PSN243]